MKRIRKARKEKKVKEMRVKDLLAIMLRVNLATEEFLGEFRKKIDVAEKMGYFNHSMRFFKGSDEKETARKKTEKDGKDELILVTNPGPNSSPNPKKAVWKKEDREYGWRCFFRRCSDSKEPVLKRERLMISYYLREMGRFPLLTLEREEKLSRVIQSGCAAILRSVLKVRGNEPELEAIRQRINIWKERDPSFKLQKQHLNYFLKSVGKLVVQYPDQKKFKELLAGITKKIEAIDKAKDEMIRANLRLVVSVAKQYMYRGLSLDDLIQEGNMGLMRAVFRFDYRKNCKFCTYATWWIRQAILRVFDDEARIIRMPVHFLELRNQFFKNREILLKELGREPTLDELAKKSYLPMNKIISVLEAPPEPISLETLICDEDSTLGDIIENHKSPHPYDLIKNRELSESVKSILSTLKPREEKIIRLRFGIGEDAEHTLEEVGKKFGVSRERIRQIEEKAFRRLRHPSRRNVLKSFLD